MSPRLAATLAIPVLGLLFLLGGLAYLAKGVGGVEYRGRAYTEYSPADATTGFVATQDRIGNRQVFVPEDRVMAGAPPAILLQDADGDLTAYRLKTDK